MTAAFSPFLPLWKRWLSLVVLICLIVMGMGKKDCHTISLADAQLAAEASEAVGLETLRKGDPIGRFKVIDIAESEYEGESIKGFVAEKGNTTIITFRGTASARQLFQQFLARVLDLSITHYVEFGGKKVVVLSFFWQVLQTFLPFIEKYLRDKERKYIITGHSLGGALASLLALYMMDKDGVCWTHPESCLITFGAPRVGGKDYAAMHDELIPANRKIRFVNRRDIVPHIPVRPAFVHHSREVYIGKLWRKWWGDYRYWQVCKKKDSKECSNSIILKGVLDHRMTEYKRVLDTKPTEMYDKYSKKRRTFHDCMVASC